MYQFDQVRDAMLNQGYRFFVEGDYNLNLVGVRTEDTRPNTFNDWLCALFFVNGAPHCYCFPATTDPGIYYRRNPIHVDGTAVVAPGQYPGVWILGQHRNQYEALVQSGPIAVYRDPTRDDIIDIQDAHWGEYGINCHRASARHRSTEVGRWSAGCQVLADPHDFDLLMALCKKSAALWGGAFTYTLLESQEIAHAPAFLGVIGGNKEKRF